MGGNGAIMVALRNQDMFKSVSAFCWLCNPSESPLCNKILTGYPGADKATWADYDSTLLLKKLGTDGGVKYRLNFRLDSPTTSMPTATCYPNTQRRPGMTRWIFAFTRYNHGYYFISSFMDEHIEFHAKRIVRRAHG